MTHNSPVLEHLNVGNGVALSPQVERLWIGEFGTSQLHRLDLTDATRVASLGGTDGKREPGDVALASAGLCQLRTWLISEELASVQLETVLDDYTKAEMPIHVLWPKNRYLRPGVHAVIDSLTQTAQCNVTFGL